MAEKRTGIGRFFWFGVAVVSIAIAALIAPFFIPLGRFLPEITAQASAALGQPVAIDSIALRLLPSPRVALSGLRIGKDRDVEVADLQVVPALLSLFGERKVISEIRAVKVRVKESALALASAPRKGTGGDIAIRRVVLREVLLEHASITLPEFDLQLRLGDGWALDEARLEMRDGSLKLLLDPQDSGDAKLEFEAKKWRLPAGAPLVVDALKGQGTLRKSTLQVPAFDGRLYGGKFAGVLKADWTRQIQIGGSFDVSGLDIAALQAALGKKPALTGRLEAKGSYSANAKAVDQLAGAIVVEAPFKVHNGALQGFDLSQAVNVFTGKMSGGQTRFDELSGKLALRGKRVRVNDLCAKSSVLTAGGVVEKAPDDHLSGRLDVSISGSRGWVGVPVALGGTLANPYVTPTRGATIGAVVGTVLLPGIGTTLGARAGAATEKTSGCR